MKCWECGHPGVLNRELGPAWVVLKSQSVDYPWDPILCRLCWWAAARGASLALKFVTPPPEAFVNVLVYGPPKTRKTAGAASAPGPHYYLNMDLPNAIRFAHDTENEDGHVQWIEYEGFATLVDITKIVKGPADDRPQTVTVDPVGELHRRLLEEQSNRAIRPTLNQYGDVSAHLERFCRMLCEEPVNAVFVCHDHPVKDETSGSLERLPYTGTSNPALGQKLMGMVDVIAYTGVIEKEGGGHEYVSQLVAGRGRQGGDRFNVLGIVRTTDLGEWFSIIRAVDNDKKAKAAKPAKATTTKEKS